MIGPETRDELVERIARAVHHHAYQTGHEWCGWDRLSPFVRRHYMTDARVMLDTLHPETGDHQ